MAAFVFLGFWQSELGWPHGNIRDADVLDLVGISLAQPRWLLVEVDRNLEEIRKRLWLPPAAMDVLRMGVLERS